MIINTLYELDYKDEMSDSNKLLLRWREEEDGQWARKEKVVDDYEPYCYVPLMGDLVVSAKDAASTRVNPTLIPDHQTTKWMVERLEPTDKLTSDGRALIKVVLPPPVHFWKYADVWPYKTYGGKPHTICMGETESRPIQYGRTSHTNEKTNLKRG